MQQSAPEATGTRLQRTAFVSGHIDLPRDQFLRHYQSALDKAIAANDTFILSNSNGADRLALQYLLSNNVQPSHITVFLHTPPIRRQASGQDIPQTIAPKYNNQGLSVQIIEGSHTQRDTAMTAASDYDILWVRPDEESRALYGTKYRAGRVSGTQKNRDRRREKDSNSRG